MSRFIVETNHRRNRIGYGAEMHPDRMQFQHDAACTSMAVIRLAKRVWRDGR